MPFDYQMVTFEEIIKNDFFKWTQVFKFRKWFKYGLMAQKFQKQHALKGAEALSPGQRPGFLFWAVTCRPERAKALKYRTRYKAVALTGRIADWHYTQGAALG